MRRPWADELSRVSKSATEGSVVDDDDDDDGLLLRRREVVFRVGDATVAPSWRRRPAVVAVNFLTGRGDVAVVEFVGRGRLDGLLLVVRRFLVCSAMRASCAWMTSAKDSVAFWAAARLERGRGGDDDEGVAVSETESSTTNSSSSLSGEALAAAFLLVVLRGLVLAAAAVVLLLPLGLPFPLELFWATMTVMRS